MSPQAAIVFAMTVVSPSEVTTPTPVKASGSGLALTGLAALGIVFGDIGTSPLYTLKTAFDFLSGETTPDRVLGILSLVIWTLFLITSIKYVTVAMSIDNDGEGGILSLMALLGRRERHRPVIVIAGLFGAALIYGDGAITPAISVLSALEGLNIAAPAMEHYIVPAAVAFCWSCLQHSRSARRGSALPSVQSCCSGFYRLERLGSRA